MLRAVAQDYSNVLSSRLRVDICVLAMALLAASGCKRPEASSDDASVGVVATASPVPRSSGTPGEVGSSAAPREPSSEGSEDPIFKAFEPQIRAFVTRLQTAVNAHDKAGVADPIQFPVRVQVLDGKRVRKLISRDEFLSKYEEIVTSCIRDRINKLEPSSLHGSWKGFDIGHGQVWFSLDVDGPRITTFNNDSESCITK